MRRELFEMNGTPRRTRRVDAAYDAASESTEYSKYWANADTFDADSANSRAVREKLVPRSRYEIGSNGYSDGIARTYSTDLVGIGPKLRMQTGNKGFNQLIERTWKQWASAVQFRRKLWCLAHAKHSDGEGIGVVVNNPGVNHAVKLDIVLRETEQCQSPWGLLVGDEGRIDGIDFDSFGNATRYNFLKNHPGSNNFATSGDYESVSADSVLHWFILRRPGQHRGVPECASTLHVGAASKRWREAVLASAETIADFTLFLKTAFEPESEEIQLAADFSTQEITKRMLTALPVGYEPFQPKAEQPTATHAEFSKSLINEQARPKSMPYNKAACDSSDYNYASGRLDHQTYYGSLDVDRADGDDLVLNPLFDLWIVEAAKINGWLGGRITDPQLFPRSWDWPKHAVADILPEAKAADQRLRNGSLSLSKHYSNMGEDFEDELELMANDYGVKPDEMRKILLHELHPSAMPAAPQTTPTGTKTDDEEIDGKERECDVCGSTIEEE